MRCIAAGEVDRGSAAKAIFTPKCWIDAAHDDASGETARTTTTEPKPSKEALKEAAKAGNVADVETLLADGVHVDTVDEQGYTALYCATMYEKEEAVVALLAAGAEVDKENNNGVSPLMAAARDGFTTIVGRLLAAGADFSQVDEFGRTANSIAEEKGHPETAAVLKKWASSHSPPVKVPKSTARSQSGKESEGGALGRGLSDTFNVSLKLKEQAPRRAPDPTTTAGQRGAWPRLGDLVTPGVTCCCRLRSIHTSTLY